MAQPDGIFDTQTIGGAMFGKFAGHGGDGAGQATVIIGGRQCALCQDKF
ncbi:MAG: hypothetical protein J1F16_05740 [Muribaculaceae bacterium]|nr:hypothetical protein [Muribaculaceae bacterium]